MNWLFSEHDRQRNGSGVLGPLRAVTCRVWGADGLAESPLDEILDLFAYNAWANDRILVAAGRLPEEDLNRDHGSSFPSIHGTLVHLLLADWLWLRRWRGGSPNAMPSSWDLATLPAIRDKWADVEEGRSVFLASLTAETLATPVGYETTSGESHSAPLWQLLRHAVNHATYHRGQVATMLRQLGHRPPSTDLVVFHRERKASTR